MSVDSRTDPRYDQLFADRKQFFKDCEELLFCTICGDRIFSDPSYVDDEVCCSYCYENNISYCINCDAPHMEEAFDHIYFTSKNNYDFRKEKVTVHDDDRLRICANNSECFEDWKKENLKPDAEVFYGNLEFYYGYMLRKTAFIVFYEDLLPTSKHYHSTTKRFEDYLSRFGVTADFELTEKI